MTDLLGVHESAPHSVARWLSCGEEHVIVPRDRYQVANIELHSDRTLRPLVFADGDHAYESFQRRGRFSAGRIMGNRLDSSASPT